MDSSTERATEHASPAPDTRCGKALECRRTQTQMHTKHPNAMIVPPCWTARQCPASCSVLMDETGTLGSILSWRGAQKPPTLVRVHAARQGLDWREAKARVPRRAGTAGGRTLPYTEIRTPKACPSSSPGAARSSSKNCWVASTAPVVAAAVSAARSTAGGCGDWRSTPDTSITAVCAASGSFDHSHINLHAGPPGGGLLWSSGCCGVKLCSRSARVAGLWCMHVCTYVCMYVRMYVCMYVCMYV